MYDLAVVGAGPAGTAAAIAATDFDLRTIVVDKATFPRAKCCGDGLTTSALRHLERMGLDPSMVPSWQIVDDVHVRAPKGRTVVLPLPHRHGIFAAVCRRSELDAELVRLARSKGAKILESHELTSIESHADHVEFSAGGEAFQARYVIAADGMWSPTKKLLGLTTKGYRGDWHAFRQYFDNVSDQAANELIVWFEPDLLPGYAWSFPLAGGSANVGFGIRRDHGIPVGDMKQIWPDLLERPHIAEWLGADAEPAEPHRAWPIPARLPNAVTTHGRVFFVGDAATATDPMTGEGIGQALETGAAAAAAINNAGPENPKAATRLYRRELKLGMIPDHRMAGLLSKALGSQKVANTALAAIDLNDWTRRNFGRWLFEDYPRAVAFNPHRWKRGTLDSDGASF